MADAGTFGTEMKSIAAILLLLFFGGCSQTSKEDALTELAQKKGYWKLAGADSFLDGGSYCLSFISPYGQILHIFVLPDRDRTNGDLVFEVRRDYNDKNPIVVFPNSEIEEQVLWLLQNYTERPQIFIWRDYANAMAYSLKHRNEAFPFGENFKKSKQIQEAEPRH
ncbi:MAG: hypothetical protein SFU85_04490 [Candidatus Methylacidiphilales bacterium]|nr:hypothetical protein [Candidatus Methylacidiphilales bacterium]